MTLLLTYPLQSFNISRLKLFLLNIQNKQHPFPSTRSTYEIDIETRIIERDLLENHRTCTPPRDDERVYDETVTECKLIL